MALVCEGVFCANFVPLAYKNRPYLGYVAKIKTYHLTDIIIIICCSLPIYPASTVCGTEGRTFESCRVRQQ